MNASNETVARAMEGEPDAAWDAYDKARTGPYIRPNIWSMVTARQHTTRTTTPEAPSTKPHKIASPPRERAFLKASRNTRDQDPQTPGIPAHNLTSNDGRLVTERETTATLEPWNKANPNDQKEVNTEFP